MPKGSPIPEEQGDHGSNSVFAVITQNNEEQEISSEDKRKTYTVANAENNTPVFGDDREKESKSPTSTVDSFSSLVSSSNDNEAKNEETIPLIKVVNAAGKKNNY